MPKQHAFPSLTHAMKKKQTRRERFLQRVDQGEKRAAIWMRGMVRTRTAGRA